MKNIESGESNAPLSRVLRHWSVSTRLPPRFQEDVWNRIARSEAAATVSPWREFAHWLERVLPRRAVVASYLTILVLAGVAAGYWNGREKAAQLRDELGARYVQSVDPFQVIDVRK